MQFPYRQRPMDQMANLRHARVLSSHEARRLCFVWAIPRPPHWTATALEDAGFQVKDVITHVFGSGFQKSMVIDKMIASAKRVDLILVHKVTGWIRLRKQELNLTNKDINIFMNTKARLFI